MYIEEITIVLVLSTAIVFGKIIDLGHGFSEETHYWAGATQFSFTKHITGPLPHGQRFVMNEFCAAEHGGTHLDAPYHFYEYGWTVDQIPVSRLYARGIRIDVSNKSSLDADYEVTIQDIQNWEKENGQIPNDSIVLIDFGWAKYYQNRTKYFGSDVNNSSLYHFPGISPEAAGYLLDIQKVVGVGVDTPSVDKGQSTDFMAHSKLATGNIYNLENVALNVEDIPVNNFTLLVMPMKIVNGTGAPCRIVAITNE